MLALAVVLAAGTASPLPPNLLLVTIDTLRADRLRAYGYSEIETPATDLLARTGVLVEDATAQAPQTRPSHASLFTGRQPYEHGTRDNYSPPLDARHPTLASLLRARGYDTAAFIGTVVLTRSSGLDRGFALYDDPFGADRGGRGTKERKGDQVVDSALKWLARPRQTPFFGWVHLYDPHAPYEPPGAFGLRYEGRPYDGEIAHADAQVGRLLSFLEQKGLRGRTLVVVTSDHGEGLGEHGEEAHLMFVYDSTLRIPLLLSWPGVLPAGARVAGQFRGVDLLPTVLELMGVPPVPTSGVSRAAQLRAGGRIPDNESYAESLYGQIHFGYAPLRALRAEGWKYIEAPRPELYNLREDPGETRNLLELRSTVAARVRERLASYDHGAAAAAPRIAVDAGTMERMAALGYLGATAPRGGGPSGADPKDKIGEFQGFAREANRAMDLFRAGDVDGALPLLTRLGRAEIMSAEVQHVLGRALIRKRRHAEAARALEEAVSLLPRFTPPYLDLSFAYLEAGQPGKALATLDRALGLEPNNADLHRARGLVLQRGGDLAGAAAALQRARALAVRDATVRLALSAVYRDLGRLADAVAEVREATRLDATLVDAWNALGLLLTASGQEAGAREAFESGLKRRPDDPDVLFNLAELHLRGGRAAQALPLLERLAVKAPAYPGAAAALAGARAAAAPPPADAVRLRLLRVAGREKAQDLARRIEAGEPFEALARQFSVDASANRGGDLGAVRPEDLAEPLRSAAAALAPGAHTGVLSTAGGYVILQREP